MRGWMAKNSEKWRGAASVFRSWTDPKSRKPLVLLVAVSLGVFLAPLTWDVVDALFYKLPRWFRWSLGEAVFLAVVAVGLRRLLRVNPTDDWPTRQVPNSGDVLTAEARWVAWALRLAVASLAFPILANPGDNLGFADWDFVLDKFEAVRRTILEWGQFPWWHPWCRGGFPLAAEPQIGALSMATPLILALGTTTGLGLSTVLCLIIAVEGGYRLAWLWFREPWSSAASALIFGLNGAVIINTAWGYVLPMSYCSLPWLALGAFRIGGRFADGLALGFWTAFAVFNGIQYSTLYAGLLAGAIWLRALRVQLRGDRARLLLNTAGAVGLFLALSGIRLATVLAVLRDDNRQRITYWDESPLAQVHHLLDRPIVGWPSVVPVQHLADYIETTSYVGPTVGLLALASLARGRRWWHALIVVTAWFALGSTRWYHPSYWTAEWPLFASTHVVTRWRFVTLLGLGLASGSVLARWRNSELRAVRVASVLLALVIAVDLIGLAHAQLPLAFSVRPEARLDPGPPVADIINIGDGLGYPCVQKGYGIIRGYEPMVGGYRRDAPTLRRAREDPNYQGEAWTEVGTIQPVSWSPNRIVFQVQPGQEVFLNQNPGSWWWLNGRPAFNGRRCAEPLVPFAVRADDAGRVDLRIHPRGLELGWGLHLFGALLLFAAWILARRSGRGPASGCDGPGEK